MSELAQWTPMTAGGLTTGEHGHEANRPVLRVVQLVTDEEQTPAPSDLVPPTLQDLPTGTLRRSPEAADMVRTAGEYLQSMAFLRIDPDVDDRVDTLVANVRQNGPTKRRLLRK